LVGSSVSLEAVRAALRQTWEVRAGLAEVDLQLLAVDQTSGEKTAALDAILRGTARATLIVGGMHAVAQLLTSHDLACFLILDKQAGGGAHEARALADACEQAVAERPLPAQRYLRGVESLREERVASLAEKAPLLERFESFLRGAGHDGTALGRMVTVADELLLNALVHAPVGLDGAARYERTGPRPDLRLAPSERIEVAYGCDDELVVLSVADASGRLCRQALRAALEASGQRLISGERPAGAGLGLSLVLRDAHRLAFYVESGRRTQVLAGWRRGPWGRRPEEAAGAVAIFMREAGTRVDGP
jgi:hypothetical protein